MTARTRLEYGGYEAAVTARTRLGIVEDMRLL